MKINKTHIVGGFAAAALMLLPALASARPSRHGVRGVPGNSGHVNQKRPRRIRRRAPAFVVRHQRFRRGQPMARSVRPGLAYRRHLRKKMQNRRIRHRVVRVVHGSSYYSRPGYRRVVRKHRPVVLPYGKRYKRRAYRNY